MINGAETVDRADNASDLRSIVGSIIALWAG